MSGALPGAVPASDPVPFCLGQATPDPAELLVSNAKVLQVSNTGQTAQTSLASSSFFRRSPFTSSSRL